MFYFSHSYSLAHNVQNTISNYEANDERRSIIQVKESTSSIGANTKVFQELELPNRDFKVTMINMWRGWITHVTRWECH